MSCHAEDKALPPCGKRTLLCGEERCSTLLLSAITSKTSSSDGGFVSAKSSCCCSETACSCSGTPRNLQRVLVSLVPASQTSWSKQWTPRCRRQTWWMSQECAPPASLFFQIMLHFAMKVFVMERNKDLFFFHAEKCCKERNVSPLHSALVHNESKHQQQWFWKPSLLLANFHATEWMKNNGVD